MRKRCMVLCGTQTWNDREGDDTKSSSLDTKFSSLEWKLHRALLRKALSFSVTNTHVIRTILLSVRHNLYTCGANRETFHAVVEVTTGLNF